jgi:hypothetical protein
MTQREALVREIADLPDDYLGDLAEFVRQLKLRAVLARSPTALVSEGVLQRDWLRAEEDEAWQHL